MIRSTERLCTAAASSQEFYANYALLNHPYAFARVPPSVLVFKTLIFPELHGVWCD